MIADYTPPKLETRDVLITTPEQEHEFFKYIEVGYHIPKNDTPVEVDEGLVFLNHPTNDVGQKVVDMFKFINKDKEIGTLHVAHGHNRLISVGKNNPVIVFINVLSEGKRFYRYTLKELTSLYNNQMDKLHPENKVLKFLKQ